MRETRTTENNGLRKRRRQFEKRRRHHHVVKNKRPVFPSLALGERRQDAEPEAVAIAFGEREPRRILVLTMKAQSDIDRLVFVRQA
jgi:hypothetical protein